MTDWVSQWSPDPLSLHLGSAAWDNPDHGVSVVAALSERGTRWAAHQAAYGPPAADYLGQGAGGNQRDGHYPSKTERSQDWLRGANRAMCVSWGVNRPLIGGPHMGFEIDLVVARYGGRRS